MSKEKSTSAPLSVVAAFDDLMRNSSVLRAGSEDQFLKFVQNSEVSRQRWEHAELECQRLSIELTKCSQDISGLEQKLQHARLMLDTEMHTRKKAEMERDHLANQLQVLRQLVMDTDHGGMDEITMDKIKNLDNCANRRNTNILSPGLIREAMECRRSAVNLTEGSVLDVEDLSFDDTLGLCESRTRAGTTFNRTGGMEKRKKRSRSGPRRSEVLVMEGNMGKRGRRSHSIGINDNVEVVEIKPREKRRSKEDKENMYLGTKMGCHNLVERTVIKPGKCQACSKRIKFGKICLKCIQCKGSLHIECREKAGTCVISSPTKVSTHPVPTLYNTPSKENRSTIFASPMLR